MRRYPAFNSGGPECTVARCQSPDKLGHLNEMLFNVQKRNVHPPVQFSSTNTINTYSPYHRRDVIVARISSFKRSTNTCCRASFSSTTLIEDVIMKLQIVSIALIGAIATGPHSRNLKRRTARPAPL